MDEFSATLLTKEGLRFVTAKYTTRRRLMTYGIAPLLRDPSILYVVIYRKSFSVDKPWSTYKLVRDTTNKWYLIPFRYSLIGDKNE